MTGNDPRCGTPATGALIRTFEGHTDSEPDPFGWYVSRRRARVLSGSWDHTTQAVGLRTGARHLAPSRALREVLSVGVSPSRRAARVLSAAWTPIKRLGHTPPLGSESALSGHSEWRHSVALLGPTAARVVSGGGDNTIKLWDAGDGGAYFSHRPGAFPRQGRVPSVRRSRADVCGHSACQCRALGNVHFSQHLEC